jgi:hypothetical protein
MAPFLLEQKVPVLVGANNFLVALCNFTVMYFFPMWFQTVALTSASTAGMLMLICLNIALTVVWIMNRLASDAEQCMHVRRVSVCRVSRCVVVVLLIHISTRWMMHRTGKYKLINLIFGFFPVIGISLITLMREDSGPLQMWLSIVSAILYFFDV